MNYVLAIFRSRTQAQVFLENIRREGARCQLVPTPPEAGAGCGVSARITECDLSVAKKIISYRKLNSFYGFFRMQRITGRTTVKKIY